MITPLFILIYNWELFDKIFPHITYIIWDIYIAIISRKTMGHIFLSCSNLNKRTYSTLSKALEASNNNIITITTSDIVHYQCEVRVYPLPPPQKKKLLI